MGKTPEKAMTNATALQPTVATTMRYRRKAPTASEPTVASTASESATKERTQDDNQSEHRESEVVDCDAVKKEAVRHYTTRSGSDKALSAASMRKKKPKAADPKGEVVTVSDSGEAAEPKAIATATARKKKLKKRQLAETATTNDSSIDPADDRAASTETTPPATKAKTFRKRKQNAGNVSSEPSLLKQLLWKAKTVAPSTDLPSALSTPDSRQRNEDNNDSDSEAEDEEEMAYTVSERHNRKLQAAKSVPAESDPPVSCSPVHPLGGELSSQETQSGSDEEEAPSLFATYQNLVPTEAIEPKDLLAPALRIDTFFPTPFPLALTTDNELLQEHGVTVHQVLLEDFSFQPPFLRVQPGDVVVWRVSDKTLAMVEHSLEITVQKLQGKKQQLAMRDRPPIVGKTTTPPLRSGCAFALRFAKQAYIPIECSVYQTKGVLVVGKPKFKRDKSKKVVEEVALETDTAGIAAAPVEAAPVPAKKSKWKRKEKTRREPEQAPVELPADEEEEEQESVYHPPSDLMLSTEMDAGVCREVLTQLEEVVAAASTPVILIGDVECPVQADDSSPNQEELEHESLLSPETKSSTVADEWSGTDDEDDDDDTSEDDGTEHQGGGVIEDFQQRIIGMLRRSEEARAQQRNSFHHEESGFDAGAAYDFFKRRFTQVQEDRAIVYSVCPEQQSGAGVGVTDVVSLLTQPSL